METAQRWNTEPRTATNTTVTTTHERPNGLSVPPVQAGDLVWWDGRLSRAQDIRLSPFVHGLHYGTGVFEGIRCYDGPRGPALFRATDHVHRFFASARTLGIRIPFSEAGLVQAAGETVRANQLADAYVRPIAFLGQGSMGFAVDDKPVHVAVAAWPWPSYHGTGRERGIHVRTVSVEKTATRAIPAHAKACGAYVNSVLAFQEARRLGADEGILLDPEGFIAEATGENVFMFADGTITTPPTATNLPGITRDTVMRLASEAGIPVREGALRPQDLAAASEVFLTGTAAEVTPVGAMDGADLVGPVPGPVTRRLQRAYMETVRGDDEHPEWLTPVYEAIVEPSAMNGGI